MTQPLLVPTAISPLTAMTVGCPIALFAICSACEIPAADGNALPAIRFSEDHLMLRAGGEGPSERPLEDAIEAGVPEGSSEVEGKSRRLLVEERREMLSKALVEEEAYCGLRGGLPLLGNSRAVS
jgi:hypothetical protein